MFIVLVRLRRSLLSEKILIFNRWIGGLMPNLIKKNLGRSLATAQPHSTVVGDSSISIENVGGLSGACAIQFGKRNCSLAWPPGNFSSESRPYTGTGMYLMYFYNLQMYTTRRYFFCTQFPSLGIFINKKVGN